VNEDLCTLEDMKKEYEEVNEIFEEAKDIVASYDVYTSDALHVPTFRFLERRERLDGFLCDGRHYDKLENILAVLKLHEIQFHQ